MDEQKSTSQSSEVVKRNPRVHSKTEESLKAIIAHVDGAEPALSDRNVAKYFALKSETIKAVRADHEDIKELTKHGRKYNLYYLLVGSAVIVIAITLIGIFDKKYLGQFFQLLFAFLGGTGVGSYLSGKNSNE